MADELTEFGNGKGQTPLSALGQGTNNNIASGAGLVGSILSGFGSGKGSGGIPNAPDTSGNINNANKTFDSATSKGDQTFNTAVGYNDEAHKHLNGVLNLGDNAASAIFNNARTNLDTYNSTFSPLQKQQADMAAQYGSDANVQRLQGRAVADANAGAQAARRNSAAALAAEGVDPASVHGAALDRQAAVAGAANAAGAGTNSAINTQLTAQGLVNQANQIGLQVGQQGIAGGQAAAGVANQGQEIQNQTNSSGVQNLTAADTYLNTGVNANQSSANIAHTGFEDQLASAKAKQAASGGGFGGALSGAAGFVASNPEVLAMAEGGGPIPEPTYGVPTSYSQGGNVSHKGALPVSPIPGSTDTKPALLTPGEFVMPKDVVDFKGQDYFHRQIDSIRKQKNKRMAIPVHHAPHISKVQ